MMRDRVAALDEAHKTAMRNAIASVTGHIYDAYQMLIAVGFTPGEAVEVLTSGVEVTRMLHTRLTEASS